MANISSTPTISDVMGLQASIENLSIERKIFQAKVARWVPEIEIAQTEDGSQIQAKITVNGVADGSQFTVKDFVNFYSDEELVQMIANDCNHLYYKLLKEEILPKVASIRARLKQKNVQGSL